MSGQKRKQSDAEIRDEDVEVKKSMSKTDINETEKDTNAINGMHFDATQEYTLEDSNGFNFDLNEPLSNDNVEIEIPFDSKRPKNDSTEENSPDIVDTGSLNVTNSSSEGTEQYTPDFEEELDVADAAMLQKKETEYFIHSDSGNGESSSTENVVKDTLQKFESVQKDAELISCIVPGVDVSEIYDKILVKRKERNRVDIVTNEIFEIEDNTKNIDNESDPRNLDDDTIFKEVAKILVARPSADPSRVYDLLEQLKGTDNRVETVTSQLMEADYIPSRKTSDMSVDSSSSEDRKSSSKPCSGDPFHDPAFKTNPLYRDFRTLKKVLPDKDPAEVYAFLEAHYEKPNRVQVVIDELTKSESQESLPLIKENSSENLIDKGKAPMTIEDKFQADFKELRDIFRDCDPNYLYEKLNERTTDKERVQKVAAELFEKKNYPKLKDVLEKENKQKLKSKATFLDFDIKTFLQKFPNPVEYFHDTARALNQNYKEHVLVYLKNSYPYLKDGYIKKVLQRHNDHLAPAVQQIEEELPNIMGRASKKKRVTPRDSTLEYPEDPDEPFFQELIFCQHRQYITDFIAEQTHLRTMKIEAARKHGELMECGCCYDDECLFEEMSACADGHIFCKECIRRSSESAIGEGKTKFLCLTGTCDLEFPLSVLQEVLPPTTFSLALRKMQEEELRQADIPDLVSCPFCSFATIMPNPEDKVFKCLNQECLKESCRLCKEPNHIPLRCNEVEKQGATNMRTYIETKVSEAMLRICPKCKKRFYKASGCNKMTCTCGTTMCYVCRTPNIDYDHFNDGRCGIDMDIDALHQKEMEAAAIKAKEDYLRDHPDQDPNLGFGNLLDKLKKNWGEEKMDYDDDDADEEGYEDDDDDYDDYY